ncbi:MAG: alpha/beta fold hydrolase [Promethearchaeota archaeon]
MSEELKLIFNIPDLIFLDVSHSADFFLIISNKNNTHNVFKIDLNNLKEWIPVTRGEDRVFTGHLSSDDSRFVFPKEQGGNEKHDLFVTDLTTLETSLLVNLNSIRVYIPKWAPDDQNILFGGSTDTNICLWKFNLDNKDLDVLYKTTQLADMGQINPKQPLVSWAEFKPDNPKASLIKVINYKTGEIRNEIQGSPNSMNESISWNDDGKQLLLQTDAPGENTLAVWDNSSEEITLMQATELGLAIDYTTADWLPGKDEIIYAAKKNGRTRLYTEKISTEDPPVELSLPEGWVNSLKTIKTKPELVYLEWSNLANPTQILEYNIVKSDFKIIANSIPSDFKLKLSEAEFITYPTFDSRNIPAFQIAPLPERQLPGNPIIILIHGGPSWEFSHDWQAMGNIIQLYASAGYRVFCPNIRGSTGYGKEFLELNIGDLGGGDLKDVLEARKYLHATYPDSKFQFLTGASYGGFMTFLTMTKHPGLFTAGAAIVGITDWFAMHRLGDRVFKSFTERFFLGSPEQKSELYKDRSAINFVENLTEPLLIIHRENDSRCPVEPIYTFVGKALSFNKEIEIYVEREAGHGFQKRAHLEKQYGKVVEFFLKITNRPS